MQCSASNTDHTRSLLAGTDHQPKKQLCYCDAASGIKVDSFNPKCNQFGCMKPLRQKLTPSMLVAFRIEGVNFDAAAASQ